MTAYVQGIYSDFHDFGETHVYTPVCRHIEVGERIERILFDSPDDVAQCSACRSTVWRLQCR